MLDELVGELPAPALTANMQLPDSFRDSYSRFSLYPCNLIDTGYYQSTLDTYRDQLREDGGQLFIGDTQLADVDLPVWDTIPPRTRAAEPGGPDVLDKWHIRDESELKDFLSDESTLTSESSSYTGELATRRDPKCRYMSVHLFPEKV